MTTMTPRYWRLRNGLTVEQRAADDWLVWDGPGRLMCSGSPGQVTTWLLNDPMTTRDDLSRAIPTDRIEGR